MYLLTFIILAQMDTKPWTNSKSWF